MRQIMSHTTRPGGGLRQVWKEISAFLGHQHYSKKTSSSHALVQKELLRSGIQ